MFRLPHLFGSKPSRLDALNPPALDSLLAEVNKLERTMGRTADPVTRAREWNRVALMAAGIGEDGRAKQYFGRAIDAYIESGFYDTAAALCKRFLVQYPDVVRAHCTLALLCVVRRDLGDAVEAIQSYARAAKRTNTDTLAVSRLRLVAVRAADEDVRHAAMQAIGELGDLDAGNDSLPSRSASMSPLTDAEKLNDLVTVALLNEMEVRLNEMEVHGRISGSGAKPESSRRSGPGAVRTRFPEPVDFAMSDTHWVD